MPHSCYKEPSVGLTSRPATQCQCIKPLGIPVSDIAQAITKWCTDTRGPGHAPILIHWYFCHSGLASRTGPYWRRGSSSADEQMWWRSLGIPIRHPPRTQGGCHGEVRTMARCDRTYLIAPSQSLSPWSDCRFKSDWSSMSTSSSVSSRSDRSGGPQTYILQLMLQGALEAYENQSASLQGQRCEGCCQLSKLVLGLNCVSPSLVLRLHPSPLCDLLPTRLSQGVGKELWGQT